MNGTTILNPQNGLDLQMNLFDSAWTHELGDIIEYDSSLDVDADVDTNDCMAE